MATRHNTCINPGCGASVSGWTGGSVPAPVAGLVGMGRTTGARYTAGGYIQTPGGAAGPGDVLTMGVDVLTEVFSDPVVDVYFFVTRSAGGDAQVGALETHSLVNGVVSRLVITRTCPANTTGAYMIIDGINMVISPTSATALLTEVAASDLGYFDGTVPGPPTSSWDGTAELSASTLTDVPPTEVVLAGQLPLMRAAGSVESVCALTLAGSLPLMRASGAITMPSDLVGSAGWNIEQAAAWMDISQAAAPWQVAQG